MSDGNDEGTDKSILLRASIVTGKKNGIRNSKTTKMIFPTRRENDQNDFYNFTTRCDNDKRFQRCSTAKIWISQSHNFASHGPMCSIPRSTVAKSVSEKRKKYSVGSAKYITSVHSAERTDKILYAV